MILYALTVVAASLGVIYVAVGLIGQMFFAPLNKKLRSDEYRVKVQEFKKNFWRNLQHKFFPHMILHTVVCILDDNTRMVWEAYRYDIDATMMFVANKQNGNYVSFETSIKLNNKIIDESVKQYRSGSDALDVFDKFCNTRVDIYQLSYNS
jgi:hypothetical protein